MRVGIYYHHNRDGSALQCCRCFAEGLARHGVAHFLAELGMCRRDCDVAVCWGARSAERLAHRPYVLLENGYLGKEGADPYRSVGINGLGGRADYGNRGMPPDRWRALGIEVAPWRAGDGCVIVCGQVLTDRSHTPWVDITTWYRRTVEVVARLGRGPVLFRPHPRCRASAETPPVPGVPISCLPLAEDLARARCLVTFNSTVGVDAAVAGVPLIACDEGSMAYAVAGHDPAEAGDPPRPDRTQWGYDLAYAQWRQVEIAAGEAWAHLEPWVHKALERTGPQGLSLDSTSPAGSPDPRRPGRCR
jgi:hypothetical protein